MTFLGSSIAEANAE